MCSISSLEIASENEPFCDFSWNWRCLLSKILLNNDNVGFKWKLCGNTSNILRPFSCVIDIFVENGIRIWLILVGFEDSFDNDSNFTAIMLYTTSNPVEAKQLSSSSMYRWLSRAFHGYDSHIFIRLKSFEQLMTKSFLHEELQLTWYGHNISLTPKYWWNLAEKEIGFPFRVFRKQLESCDGVR